MQAYLEWDGLEEGVRQLQADVRVEGASGSGELVVLVGLGQGARDRAAGCATEPKDVLVEAARRSPHTLALAEPVVHGGVVASLRHHRKAVSDALEVLGQSCSLVKGAGCSACVRCRGWPW